MLARGVQGTTIELRQAPDQKAGDKVEYESSSAAKRMFRPRSIVSLLLALAVFYLMYRELLGLDWREVCASIQGASVELFALLDTRY